MGEDHWPEDDDLDRLEREMNQEQRDLEQEDTYGLQANGS